jgi:non-canonical purine NTP pyrophosphatase (RdgB/HAM1 family)
MSVGVMIKKIIFLTGNKNKLKEFQEIIGESVKIGNKDIDLPEIQSTDVLEVVKEKLKAAIKILKKPCIVDDTGLHFEKLNQFPGALIKFYSQHLKNKGICERVGGSKATAVTVIGYYDGKKTYFFTGKRKGTVPLKPKGKGFGWDPVFIPKIKDNKKTYAEMSNDMKNKISQRKMAVMKLKKHLQ